MPRFASKTGDLSQAQNVIAYTILADGIPFIYAGQEHQYIGGADPTNREATWLAGYNTSAPLYQLTARLNQVRNTAIYQDANYVTYKNWPIYNDASTIAMRKGLDGHQIVTVLNNRGQGGDAFTLYLPNHGWAVGTQVLEVLGCTTATVDGNGYIPIRMGQGLPKVLYPVSKTAGTGICSR